MKRDAPRLRRAATRVRPFQERKASVRKSTPGLAWCKVDSTGPSSIRASAGQARCALLREGERLSALLLAVLEPLVAFCIAVRRLRVSFACTDAGRLLLEARLHTAIPFDDRRTWGKAPRRQQTGRREHNKDHLPHSDSSFASINQVCRNPRAIANAVSLVTIGYAGGAADFLSRVKTIIGLMLLELPLPLSAIVGAFTDWADFVTENFALRDQRSSSRHRRPRPESAIASIGKPGHSPCHVGAWWEPGAGGPFLWQADRGR